MHAAFAFPGIRVFVTGDSTDLPLLRLRSGHATADSFALPLAPEGRSLILELRAFQHSRLRQPLQLVAAAELSLPAVNRVRHAEGALLDALPVLELGRPLELPSIGCGLFVLSDAPAEFRCWPLEEPYAVRRLDLDQPQPGRTYRTIAERLRTAPGSYRFEAQAGELSLAGEVEIEAGVYTVLGLRFGPAPQGRP